jgi:hypothetical protein
MKRRLPDVHVETAVPTFPLWTQTVQLQMKLMRNGLIDLGYRVHYELQLGLIMDHDVKHKACMSGLLE